MATASGDHPLRATAERADAACDWLTIGFGGPVRDGWTVCSDVDGPFVADWEAGATEFNLEHEGRSHPAAAASYVLEWYAGIASRVGAMCYFLARRVPLLDRPAIAFRRHPEEQHPDAITLLDRRFWCLPDDPASGHSDATVLADEQALAAVLRAQIRSHADDFLASYRPGAKLPRRYLLGAFFDGLDSGFWIDDQSPTRSRDYYADAHAVLPGDTPEFTDRSTFRFIDDRSGGEHLTRCRVSCCYYYKVSDGGETCTTCPRTSEDDRRRRVTAYAG